MNKNQEKAYQIEKLIDDAWKWWQELADFEQEHYILRAYMKHNNINESEVEI